MAFRTRSWLPFLLSLGLCATTLLLPGCAYIAKQARGQLELLVGRVPLETARATVDFTGPELELLDWVPRIKAFGEQKVGMSPTKNYTTINPGFSGVIWNVSAAAPDRFVSHRYHYPVVGALPYIGFWNKDDARAEVVRLQELGWETYMRRAGAYSTLGWFRDPLWRSMLQWDFERFANTVLHELAHSTLWLAGHGDFNESFASFLGDRATDELLQSLTDEHPGFWQKHQDDAVDRDQYRRFMHRMVGRIQALYGAGLSRAEVAVQRELLIEDARIEYASLTWRNEGYARAMRAGRNFNNARLRQFRVYNTGMDDFDRALKRFGGDLPAFVASASEELPRARRRGGRGWDPYEALRELAPE